MFDIGLPEILVIAVIALFVVGPQDIPKLLYRLGKVTRSVTKQWDSVRNTLGDAIHEAELSEYREKAKSQKNKVVKELLADFEPEKIGDEIMHSAVPEKPVKPVKKAKAAKKNG